MSEGRPGPAAEDLQIAGIQALSTVDWPGKLAAVLFLQGCPWRCPYCHNFEILDMRRPGEVPWSSVRELLARRRGLLDGVVFSGGEATRQAAVLDAAREVHEAGFSVGLHTAGAYPAALSRLLSAGAVDWVGLDIKAMPEDYGEAAGLPGAGGATAAVKAAESLRRVLESGVDYEVRLTLWRGGLDYALRVARWCRDQGVRRFALQRLQEEHVPGGFAAGDDARRWDADLAEFELGKVGFDWVAVRG